MSNPVRISIESASIPKYVTKAIWKGGIAYRKGRKERIDFDVVCADQIIFTEADYEALIALEDTCEVVAVTIERNCGTWQERFIGEFTMNEVEVNKSTCKVSATPKQSDSYVCFGKNVKDKEHLFNLTIAEVRPFRDGWLEYIQIDETFSYSDTPPTPGTGGPTDGCFSHMHTELIMFEEYVHRTFYYRIRQVGRPGGLPPGYPATGWTLLNAGTNEWVRCPDLADHDFGVHENGRPFNAALEHLVTALGCGLTVVSDFFGINPDNTAPANTAYAFAAEYLTEMVMLQKSDVKCQTCSNAALRKAWELTLDDLLADLAIMLNVRFLVQGSTFRIEHVSYWDITNTTVVVPQRVRLAYTKDAFPPKTEQWYYSDENAASDEFLSPKIDYDCGTEQAEYKLKLFNNDIGYVANSAHIEDTTDEGFVLISAELVGGKYYAKEGNLPLSWPRLITELHAWDRPYLEGTIDGTPITFQTVRPTKKAQAFTVILPCSDTFDPTQRVETGLGLGYVESAKYNLFTCTLELELNY